MFNTKLMQELLHCGQMKKYKEATGLMFRFAAFKDKHALTDLDIRVNTGLLVVEDQTLFTNILALHWKEPGLKVCP